jgi:Tfp pilus assembly protein PilV
MSGLDSKLRERGLSLIELIMFIVIVGAAVAGIITMISRTTQSSADPMIRKQALSIAEAMLDEIRLQPFTVCDADDSSGGVVTVDAVSSNSAGGSSSSLTVPNHTTSGSNRLMLVGISISNDGASGARQINSVTYSGVNLTQVCTGSVDDDARVWIYRLIAPPVTTANVAITLNGNVASGGNITAGVMTFTGVDQTTPLGTCVTDTNDSSPHAVTVTSVTNELVFDVFSSEGASMTMAGSPAGRTQRWNTTANSNGGGGSTAPGASSVNMTWTANSGGDHWAVAGVPIKPGCVENIGPEAGETRYSSTSPFDHVNDYHGFDSNTAVPPGIRTLDGTLIPGLDGYRVTVSVAAQPVGGIGNDAQGNPQSLLITVTVTGPGNTTVVVSGYRTRYAPNETP